MEGNSTQTSRRKRSRRAPSPSASGIPSQRRPQGQRNQRQSRYFTGNKVEKACSFCHKQALESTALSGVLVFLCEDCVWY